MLVTIGLGVLWELFQYGGRELAIAGGFEPVLIVYRLEDTMWDLVFDMIGGVVGALYASRRLDRTTETVHRYLERPMDRSE